jgi:hypothetical protein
MHVLAAVRYRLTRALCLVVLASCTHSLFAQLGLRVVQLRPTGEFGMVMEKKVSAELLYIPAFEEDKLRMRASIGIFNMKPRLEVFPTNAWIYDGNGYTQLPGTQSFSKWNMTMLSGGVDLALVRLKDETLNFYPGVDIVFGGITMEYESHTPGISDEYFSGGQLMAGLRFRLGADHAIGDHLGLLLEACRAYYFVEETGRLDHNEIALGVRYQF